MSIEGIVRPFTAPAALSTRRIVTSKATDTNGAASLTWGAAGQIASGVKQPDSTITWSLSCCDHTWTQKGAPITEDVNVPILDKSGKDTGDYVVVKRVKQIKVANSNKDGCDDSIANRSYVAAAVKSTLADFSTSISGNKDCNATYNYKWK